MKRKNSIRWKITLVMVLAIISCIILCIGLNRSILPKYYLYTKVSSLENAFEYLEDIFENAGNTTIDDINSETAVDIRRFYAKLYGISDDMLNSAEWYLEGKNIYVSLYVSYVRIYYTSSSREAERMDRMLGAYRLSYTIIKPEPELLRAESNYDVYKTENAEGEKYIDLIGKLDNDYIIYLRTSFESIEESAYAANKLLTYIGIVTVIIGALCMYLLSKKFSKPITELSLIAKRMTNLDFDAVYNVTTKDEIGELGNSINILSSKLHNTIVELKNANNELMSDIEDKIQIDEMRKEFLSNVTHELKTPIALIQGYAEGLKDNINEDQESREFYCDVIIDESVKMNNMVKKLLSLNQIEFGKNQVCMDKFDINALIKSVINSADILIKNNNIKVIFEYNEPVYVWADEYMIEEVMTNYISNAIHHIDFERIIEVKVIVKEKVVRVTVFNTGEQIPDEDIEKIWIKFYKVDKARTREYGGSGIGLSIVKAIMDNHHKECGVINHSNGVEFWYELEKS